MHAEIDHLVNLDPGGRGNRHLYDAAFGGRPLVEAAAEILHGSAAAGDTVLLTTGFPVMPDAQPETDGPPGAVALAQAVDAVGGEPVVAVEPSLEETVKKLAEVLDCTLKVETVSPDADVDFVQDVFHQVEPEAVVAVEKPGRTQDGSYRNMSAMDVSRYVFSVDHLFEAAEDADVSTVAVGDGGNEVGMGGVREAVERHVAHGSSVAAVTSADRPVLAGVSNWGAYGVIAAMSLFEDRNLVHAGDTERLLIEECVSSGCVDGVTGEPTASVDGFGVELHASVVDLVREIVEEQL